MKQLAIDYAEGLFTDFYTERDRRLAARSGPLVGAETEGEGQAGDPKELFKKPSGNIFKKPSGELKIGTSASSCEASCPEPCRASTGSEAAPLLKRPAKSPITTPDPKSRKVPSEIFEEPSEISIGLDMDPPP